ncbi:MAG: hypothetical protein EBT21_04745 [Actinobacteria bacterium]|nr:hypothetical protein [Actinomycetota bacterium]
MYTMPRKTIPTVTLLLDPREIELIIRSLAESIEEEAEYGNDSLAAELAVLQRRLSNVDKALITH